MPNVKLLKHVSEGGGDLAEQCAMYDKMKFAKNDPKYPKLKVIRRRNPNWFAPQEVEGKLVVCTEPQILAIKFVPGTVVTMNADGIAKWVKLGLCEVTDEPQTAYSAL